MKSEVIGTTTIYTGDCIESMKTMPDQSVNMCVTSPPYYGLRDYGVDGQIGLESDLDEYISKMVVVFQEVRRVLRDDGTVWLNIGDSYNSNPGQRGIDDTVGSKQESNPGSRSAPSRYVNGYKPKDILGVPWRVAFALQADGWYLRQDIIWHKPNPMPESVRDRCTKSHEYIFLLSKSSKYRYDYEAIKEPAKNWGTRNRLHSSYVGHEVYLGGAQTITTGVHENNYEETGRNKRSVWSVATKPFKEAHFATFPIELIEPCILAGCPEKGVVLDPFGGSGTTAVAAHMHNRKSVLCELNPEYIDIARERIENAQRQQALF